MSTKLRKKSLIVRLRRSSAMVDVSLHGNTTHPGIDSAAVRHWRRYLGGIEPCYVPSLGQAQGQGDKEPVRSIELQLGSDERLTEISKEHRVLAASILQTAWALVLKRHLGRESTCFGCQSLSYEDIVERPTSTHSFALRNDWPRHKTAIEAAQHVGNQFARSMLHQGCSLVQINTHAPSGGPMFNTAMFIYNHEHTKIDLPNCQSLQCGHDVRMMEDDQIDLWIDFVDCNGRMVANLRYKPTRISEEQALEISRAFGQTISGILRNPHMLAKDVGLQGQGNQERIVVRRSGRSNDQRRTSRRLWEGPSGFNFASFTQRCRSLRL